jgi:hypothetical protein
VSPRRVALLAAVLLLPLLLIITFGAEQGLYQVYVPSGYVKEVDRLIDEDNLVYDCATQRIEPRGLSDAGVFFLENSYLRRDLGRWNAGDRRPFVVEHRDLGRGRCEGEVLRANATFHSQRLPDYTASTWRGRLFFRLGQPTVSLASPDRRIEVGRASWERLPLPAAAYTDVWVGPRRDSRQRGDERAEKMALKWREAGRMFASLEHVGDQPAVEVYEERPAMLLNGCAVRTGARLRLDGGDWLWLQEEGRINEQYRVESGAEASLLSFISVVNGELRRRTFGNRLPMADEVTAAIDAAVRAEREGGRDDFDVHLTLDAFFQDFVTRRLAAFCRRTYGRRPLRAAVTLLEPSTGRVLALGSYPSAGDLEDLRLKSDVHKVVLGQNHNFLVHAIGSATKPFLATAALATQPRLAQLTIPCHGGGDPPPRLMGYDFGRYSLPPDCGPGGAPIDFRRFLEVSSNRYMLALGILGLAEWQGGQPLPDRAAPPLVAPDGYRLGGVAAVHRPVLTVVKDESRAGATELAGVQDTLFYQRFRDLFGHAAHYAAGPPERTLAMRYWAPVTEATAGVEGDVALAFSPVTPERVNLRANLIQQARQDLYTNLLGLGNNRWSNLQLAESLARLVTGRKIDAHLIEHVAVPAPAGERRRDEVLWDLEKEIEKARPAPLPLADESRRLVLDGMTQVVTGQRGTARALAPVLAALNARAPQGVRYSALGKTGTPSTELAVVRRGPTEPAPATIRRDRVTGLGWVDHGILVLALTRHEGATSESLVLTIYVEAQGSAGQAVAVAADLLRPLAEAYWPKDWMALVGAPPRSQ